jgi:hypothetical protein
MPGDQAATPRGGCWNPGCQSRNTHSPSEHPGTALQRQVSPRNLPLFLKNPARQGRIDRALTHGAVYRRVLAKTREGGGD